MNDATPQLRPVVPSDLPFLWDMLYEAALVAAEIRVLEKRAALALPSIARHLNGWGRAGDAGVIAVAADGSSQGAAWYRLYAPEERGYGIVAWPNVPELSIGVAHAHRGCGVGGALLDALRSRAVSDRYHQLTLSVDPANPARRLYARHGFDEIPTANPDLGASILMVADAAPIDPRLLLEKARTLATQAHRNQLDKGGHPYIDHPHRVADRVQAEGLEAMIVALLHDVMEDAAVNAETLRRESFTAPIIRAVQSLTRHPAEPYDAYITRIATHASRVALLVKQADLTDNLDTTRLQHPLTRDDHTRLKRYASAKATIEAALSRRE